MTPRRPGRASSLERRIEEALRPGTFIASGAAFAFVHALEAVPRLRGDRRPALVTTRIAPGVDGRPCSAS